MPLSKTHMILLLASLVCAGGVMLIWLTWRRKRARTGLWRFGLFAGWGLIALSLTGWGFSSHADAGLSRGVVVLMLAALTLIATGGLTQPRQPEKITPIRAHESDTLTLGPGYGWRFGLRLTGALVAVPLTGLSCGLLWQVYGPGIAVDRLIGMVIVSILVMAAALMILLTSSRPGLTVIKLAAIALLTAALVFVPPWLTGAI